MVYMVGGMQCGGACEVGCVVHKVENNGEDSISISRALAVAALR